ncbi:MAG: CDP-glucose 4,6-dehydratase [Candidatus Poriferisodalaceae bacterium]|jgi:CDP-glucose 4,6-dehydratase
MFKGAYEGKKVLVTGHTGFKGTWMTLWLQQMGAEVVGISDRVPTEPAHFDAAGLNDSMRTHWLDVRDTDAIRQAIIDEAPDFLFHMAAQALVKASYDDPVSTYSINAIGTASVLEGLRGLANTCSAVLITSDKCYENVETYYGYREDDRLGGADPYSASKAAAEIFISSHTRSFFGNEDRNVRIATTRAGNVVGGGDWAADRLVPDVARAWTKGENVTIRRPQATRPWQHVLEPISGYLQLGAEMSERPELHGESFNFGPPAEAVNPVRDVVLALQGYLPGLDLTIDESQAHFHEAGLLKLSCDKALSYLGWTPVMNFDETMQITAEWFARYYNDGADGIRDFTMGQLQQYTDLASKRGLNWAN